MACRKMNEDVAYARNTESGCKKERGQYPVILTEQALSI